MHSVGIRELKNQLSRHLKRVRAGYRLVVTEHGKAIATIVPIDAQPIPDWIEKPIQEGKVQWGGGKPTGSRRPPRIKGPSVSDAVLEDRR
jgi:prevent-host-death family protein